MAIQQNFPNIVPSLSLDFASVKALDPRITFSRASTATYYGTETAKAEENLLIRSQEFDNAGWAKINTSVAANTSVAPNGTTTAETYTATASTGQHRLDQTSQSTVGTQRVLSFFVKANTHNFVQLMFGTDIQAFANFNVTAGSGAVGTVGSSVTASIVDAGSGWYRCIINTTSATASAQVFILLVSSGTAVRFESWTTIGTESVDIWGAQLEARAAATNYTPTTTQPITNYIPVLESAASGVARFDHNPTTFESLGLLIEEQRTNLLLRSEEFDNAYWVKTGSSITANTIVAPDGALTGDKLVIDNGISATASTFRSADLSKAASPVTFAFSIYAKAGEYNTLRLLPRDPATAGNSADVRFNLTNGTVISAVAAGTYTAVSGVITSVGNDWYRCTALFTTGSETTVRPQVLQLNNNAAVTGDGFSGIFIWGAQLEVGAFATSYIPTVASQVTRAADAASMTGANFSSWYNQAEGTLYAEAAAPTSAQTIATISDNTSSNRILLQQGTNNRNVIITTSGVSQASTSAAATFNQYAKAAAAFATNSCQIASNTVLGVQDTTVVLPVVDRAYIGANQVGTGGFLNGHIRKLSYYPIRVSNTNLQALTS